ADVFALGCILYRCVTGRAPFLADSLVATLAKVLFDEPLSIRTIDPTLPDELEDLVNSMLAKDPVARPGDATEVAALLAGLRKRTTIGRREHARVANVVVRRERKVVSVLVCVPDRQWVATDAATVVEIDPS